MKTARANYVGNVLLEKDTPLTAREKSMFAYFGEQAKLRPPFRILNPQRISIGDRTSIREGAYLHAYADLSYLRDQISRRYRGDFKIDDYRYQSEIVIGGDVQIGRFLLLSCTNSVLIEDYVVVSERVFIGDNNHTFSHPEVPIIQQPNKKGQPVRVGTGTWVGVGAAILTGTRLGRNCVIGANAVVQGPFPSYAVIGSERAKLLFRRHGKS
jgi:acetyltransferase-like isoleucine patch superfamily enzyme